MITYNLSGTTPADIIAPVLSIVGIPPSFTYAASDFIDKAKKFIDFSGLEKSIAGLFGARSPRFSQQELSAYMFAMWTKLLGRPPNNADIEHWYPRLMYGYETLASVEDIIRSTDAYKQRKATAWSLIRQAWVEILGHEPSETLATAENNYYFKLLISGQQPIEAIRQALKDSAEYKAKHPTPDWLIPAIVGAGAIFLL